MKLTLESSCLNELLLVVWETKDFLSGVDAAKANWNSDKFLWSPHTNDLED